MSFVFVCVILCLCMFIVCELLWVSVVVCLCLCMSHYVLYFSVCHYASSCDIVYLCVSLCSLCCVLLSSCPVVISWLSLHISQSFQRNLTKVTFLNKKAKSFYKFLELVPFSYISIDHIPKLITNRLHII